MSAVMSAGIAAAMSAMPASGWQDCLQIVPKGQKRFNNNKPGSGAGLLTIASQGIDLTTQIGRAKLIAAGEGDSQGELQFFKLVFAGGVTALNDRGSLAGPGEARSQPTLA
jgi:hypothetical protein